MGKKKVNEVQNIDISKELKAILANIAKPSSILTCGEGENKFTIEINSQPTSSRRETVLRHTVNILFDDKISGVDSYMPFFYSFALRYGIILCYTNLVLPDPDSAWAILNYSKIYNDVIEVLGTDVVSDFTRDLNELIDIRKQSITHSINWIKFIEFITDALRDLGKDFKDLDVGAILSGLKDVSPETIKEFIDTSKNKIKN